MNEMFSLYDVMGSFKKKVAILGAPSTVVQINTGMFVMNSVFCKWLAVLIQNSLSTETIEGS